MAYDSPRRKVILFGGLTTDFYFSDTNDWNGTAWTPQSIAGSARFAHAIVFDTVRGVTVLFGGANFISSGDTYQLRNTVPALVTAQPTSQSACFGPGGAATFLVGAIGTGTLVYQWQREIAPGLWNNVINGPVPYPGGTIMASGALTRQLQLSVNAQRGAPSMRFRCYVGNGFGNGYSSTATLTIITCACALADVASDSLNTTRSPSGSIGPEDLDAFIAGFIAGNTAIADLATNPSDTTYSPNGSVGPEDLDAFIASFIRGC